MKKRILKKVLSCIVTSSLTMTVFTGCAANDTVPAEGDNTEENIEDNSEDNSEDIENVGNQGNVVEEEITTDEFEEPSENDIFPGAPYFTNGVYVNYEISDPDPSFDYFYVFYDEQSGYTDDAESGTGLPFSCEQTDGSVSFSFGGVDEEDLDVLTIESVVDGAVTGHFNDGKKIVFVPEVGADPDDFDAQSYVNGGAGSDKLYKSANGWSVRYNPEVITVNGGGPITTFVYTGDTIGTNMITVTYDVDKDAQTAIDDIAKSWNNGADQFTGIFPGTEDVTGYFATYAPEDGEAGMFGTAIARDYMDGYLVVELTGHNSGDEAIDMELSDNLSAIIDSIRFD